MEGRVGYYDIVETPVNKQDKYFYQILQRLDKIIELLNEEEVVSDKYDEDVEVINDCDTEETISDYNYDGMTVKELRDTAKEIGLVNYSTLKKDELIKTLKECGD